MTDSDTDLCDICLEEYEKNAFARVVCEYCRNYIIKCFDCKYRLHDRCYECEKNRGKVVERKGGGYDSLRYQKYNSEYVMHNDKFYEMIYNIDDLSKRMEKIEEDIEKIKMNLNKP